MIQPIGSGRVQGVTLGAADSTSRPGDLAAAAMSTLSTRIATTIAEELALVARQGRGGHPGGKAGDHYGVDAIAEELAAALAASPADAGRLSRALNSFVGEVAALLAAKPHSSVLGMVRGLHFDLTDHDGRQGSTDADYAVAAIDCAIFRLRENAPWAATP